MGPSRHELHPRLVCRRRPGLRTRERIPSRLQKRLRQRARVDRFAPEHSKHASFSSVRVQKRAFVGVGVGVGGGGPRRVPGRSSRAMCRLGPSDVSSVQCSIRPVGTGARVRHAYNLRTRLARRASLNRRAKSTVRARTSTPLVAASRRWVTNGDRTRPTRAAPRPMRRRRQRWSSGGCPRASRPRRTVRRTQRRCPRSC